MRVRLPAYVVLAFKRNEAGAGDACGHAPAGFEGYPSILTGVHDQCRHVDLRQQRTHIDFAICQQLRAASAGDSRSVAAR